MTGIPTGRRGDVRGGVGGAGASRLSAPRKFPLNRVLYVALQWTWGIIQNVAGVVLMMMCMAKDRTVAKRLRGFFGAVVVPWALQSSMALGMFVFYGAATRAGDGVAAGGDMSVGGGAGGGTGASGADPILVHEYGHTIQSIILGPLYLVVIGLPSLLWAWLPRARAARAQGACSYFDFYPERWANQAATRITHLPAPKR